jgi:hypothetical protein
LQLLPPPLRLLLLLTQRTSPGSLFQRSMCSTTNPLLVSMMWVVLPAQHNIRHDHTQNISVAAMTAPAAGNLLLLLLRLPALESAVEARAVLHSLHACKGHPVLSLLLLLSELRPGFAA